jgi:hypothetical protein
MCVRLGVVASSGREVSRSLGGPVAPGGQEPVWDAKGLPPGVDICLLQPGKEVQTRKILLVR